jgi:hypothetical protein
MIIILGILSTFSVIFLSILGLEITGFYLHSFSLFFIFPVGGMIAGMGCGAGVYWGLLLSGTRAESNHHIIAVVFSLFGFFGVYYGLYATTYITPDMNINHRFEGSHISKFTYKNSGEKVTFSAFLVDKVRSRSSSFFVGVGRRGRSIPIPVGSYGMGSTYNWMKFGFEGIGFLFGGFFVGTFLIGDKRHCERCHMYMKDKDMYAFDLEEIDRNIDELNTSLSSGEEFLELTKSKQQSSDFFGVPYSSVNVSYCPSCYDGFLLVKVFENTSDRSDVEELRQTILVNSEFIRKIMS